MKKVLLVLIVLILVVLAGGAVFLATLDLDKYRPQIVSRIENALGLPVQLQKITWTWHNGLALSLEGLSVQDSLAQKSLINLHSAKMVLDLAPLFHRRIQMTTLYLERPIINLLRTPSGRIQGFQTAPAAKAKNPKAGQDSTTVAAAALSFFVGKVKIDSAEILFRDEARKVPLETALHDVDIQLNNVALNEPIEIEAKAGLLSLHQNLTLKTTLHVTPQEQRLSNFHTEINLTAMEGQDLAKIAPQLGSGGKNPVSGLLTLDISSLRLNEEGLKNMLAELHLADGSYRDASTEIRGITADAFAQSGNIQIKRFSANYQGAGIAGTGNINLKTEPPAANFNVEVRSLNLAKISEAAGPNDPRIEGTVDAAFEGGFSTDVPLRTLAGKGVLNLKSGEIKNLNVLREVFRKFSVIPGLVEKLMSRLPEDYKDRLNERDTPFELPQQTSFAIKQGVVVLDRLNVKSESFALQGAGSLNLQSQMLGGQAMLLVEPNLSQALMESVRELESLANQNGIIQIPLNFQGKLPQISIVPDLQYIGSRLATAAVAGLFRKPEPSPVPGEGTSQTPVATAPETSATPAPKQKLPKGSAILGQLLEAALSPQQQQQGSGN